MFWAKMALREELGCEEKPLELLSSHPSHESRQKAIDELIPHALKLRESCKVRYLISHRSNLIKILVFPFSRSFFLSLSLCCISLFFKYLFGFGTHVYFSVLVWCLKPYRP